MKKRHLDRRELRTLLLLLTFALLLWGGYYLLEEVVKGGHYYAQMVAVAAFIVSFFALKKAYRLFLKKPMAKVTSRVKAAVGKVWKRVKGRLSTVAEKIRKALGITDYSRVRGTDEKSFLLGRREERRKKRSEEKLRWNDLLSNRERLRFVYVRFVKQSEKKGYRYHPYATPIENGSEWSFPEGTPEDTLFAAYTDARFAPEGERLNDEAFEQYAELVGKKKKKDVTGS